MNSIKKIVIIGPESTGKSTLCKQLADHYKTVWVPEFAREYLEKRGTNYTYEDLLTIAKGQIALEEEYLKSKIGDQKSEIENRKSKIRNHKPLFIDTDMYVMKVWFEFVFSKCPNRILNQIAERKYNMYLLCNTDLPWIKDELREYPDLATRNKLYHYYKDLLINQSVPWVDITGSYELRLQQAMKEVDMLLT
jgi:NadR type nicotinamide-nucleotide adenylyltransferase